MQENILHVPIISGTSLLIRYTYYIEDRVGDRPVA